jgi:hypothetical protein
VNLNERAQLHGIHPRTAFRWFREGTLPVAAVQVNSRLALVAPDVSCCVCGTVRQVRPSLVEGCTHLICGLCGTAGKRPDGTGRPGIVLVHRFNVGGFSGYTYRIATAEERVSGHRAAALAGVAVLNAAGSRCPGG